MPLIPGDLGRLPIIASPASTDRVPLFDVSAGKAGYVTIDELKSTSGSGAFTTLSTSGDTTTTNNVGTVGTNVTAQEFGNGHVHVTVLTLASVAAVIGDNASLAGGALIYTLPAGAAVIQGASMSVGMTLTTGTPTTDTPEFGLGTTIGSGANATLGDVGAGAENILGPAVAADVAGTAEILTGATPLVIEAAAAHTIYFNYADAWADVTNTAATISGTVVLHWVLMAA